MTDTFEVYETICKDRFNKQEETLDELRDLISGLREKVFNGMSTDLTYVKEYIDTVREKQRRRLSIREVWARSIAITVGGGTFTGIAVAVAKLLLHL